MKNINAFFKLCQIKKGVTISKMATHLSLDKGYLSRTFNNKNQIRKERNIHKICSFFDLDMNTVFQTDPQFVHLCAEFKRAFFFCHPQVHHLYHLILSYQKQYEWKSPYHIDILLTKLMYEVEVNHYLPPFIDYICKIMPSLCEPDQALLATYFMLIDVQFPGFSYEKEINYFKLGLEISDPHDQIRARLYYFGLSYFRKHNQPKRTRKCYLLALELFERSQNTVMLEKLFMKYSALLRAYGSFEKAAQNDLLLIDKFERQHLQLRNLEILYNNLAWTFSLLHDYQQAIHYYEKAIVTLKDNEIYFNLAFCYYKIGDKIQALHYIDLGKSAKSYSEYVFLLLEWLEAMIQKRYSKKSYMLLLKIQKSYFDDLESIMQDTIALEIVNYLYFTEQYEQALHACKPLLNKRIDSPTQLIIKDMPPSKSIDS